ncbi:MAG TPA: hypothetical protein VK891_10145 [Euzebyales bacterium]|nr:hypothetical protein [Euzebyales bacterium]
MTTMVKVLFIAGGGRTGSTILHNVIGQLDGFAAVGELRYIWGRAALKNQSCGCGVPFSDCGFWNEVLTRAFGGLERDEARRMLQLTESFRIRNLPLTAVPALRRRELSRMASYLSRLGELYAAIQEVSGCRVIVDSSKNPSYGYLLGHVEGLDVHYLHFVRDAPPVAYSWGQHKEFEPGVPMARKDAAASALQWLARNASAELFLPRGTERWRQWRYEDVMRRPRDHVATLPPWLGEDAADLPFLSAHDARIDRPNHSVFGNSTRFRSGVVTLRPDDRWRPQMGRADQATVAALTWPLRLRYGYLGRGAVAAGDTAERLPA